MDKPQKHTKEFYDYHECSNYLQEKYGYDERDYARRYKEKWPNDIPYLDFWHWVCDHYCPNNGTFITFSEEYLNDEYTKIEDWQREIYQRYIDEFADENGEIEFYVWW